MEDSLWYRTFEVAIRGITLRAVTITEMAETAETAQIAQIAQSVTNSAGDGGGKASRGGGGGGGGCWDGLVLNKKVIDLELSVAMPLDGRHAVTLRDTYGAKGLGMKIVGGITLVSLALDEARY